MDKSSPSPCDSPCQTLLASLYPVGSELPDLCGVRSECLFPRQ